VKKSEIFQNEKVENARRGLCACAPGLKFLKEGGGGAQWSFFLCYAIQIPMGVKNYQSQYN